LIAGNGVLSSRRRANCAMTGGISLRRPASSRKSAIVSAVTPSANRPVSSTWTIPERNRIGAPRNWNRTSSIVTRPSSKTNRPATRSIGGISRGSPARASVGARRGTNFNCTRASGSGTMTRW
jgi:hypothetical protein